MTQHILHGTPPVTLTLRRSTRARRISLRVSGMDGRVTLTLPQNVSRYEAIAFAESKAEWIRTHLETTITPSQVSVGDAIPFQGRTLTIGSHAGRAVRLDGDSLLVPGPLGRAAIRVQAWLKLQARDRLAEASDRYVQQLGLSYGRITLRDTRSRWGSCSSRGDLMYSWRLILAPAEVLDYVAAHEVAHLQEMNHSRAYWAIVARICPEYKQHRKWLRDHGNRLHAYRFSD